MKALLIISIVFLALGVMQTMMGSLFKIQHWPGAAVLLTCGILVNLTGILLLAIYLIVRVAGSKKL